MSEKANKISEDLFELSVAILKITSGLNYTPENKVIKDQLIRSGTSAGANYEEARGAESRADFIHKLHITYKELRETNYWLRLLYRISSPSDDSCLVNAINESEKLIRIFAKSIITTRANLKR